MRRDGRRGRVVLEHELLRDLCLVPARLVVEVEALPVGRRRRGPGTPARSRRSPRSATAIASSEPTDSFEIRWRSSRLWTALSWLRSAAAVSNSWSADSLLHLGLEVALDLAIAAREEVDDLLDALAVLLLGHVADAGGAAALDVVVEAGAARTRAPARRRRSSGAGRPCRAGRASRAPSSRSSRGRSSAVAPALLAREVDARELLVERDAMYGYDLSSRSRTLKIGRYCLMKFCSASSASASVCVTTNRCSRSASTMSPRELEALLKWPATRFLTDLAFPT